MNDTLDALLTLLDCPGWAVYRQHLEDEWGAGGKRFESTINKFADSREEDALILRQIQQIAVCRREILKLKAWPEEEIARLKKMDARPGEQIRKALPLALVGESRRGGL